MYGVRKIVPHASMQPFALHAILVTIGWLRPVFARDAMSCGDRGVGLVILLNVSLVPGAGSTISTILHVDFYYYLSHLWVLLPLSEQYKLRNLHRWACLYGLCYGRRFQLDIW